MKSRTFPIYWGDRGLGGDYEGCRGMVMVMLVVLMLPLIISLLVGGCVGCDVATSNVVVSGDACDRGDNDVCVDDVCCDLIKMGGCARGD